MNETLPKDTTWETLDDFIRCAVDELLQNHPVQAYNRLMTLREFIARKMK